MSNSLTPETAPSPDLACGDLVTKLDPVSSGLNRPDMEVLEATAMRMCLHTYSLRHVFAPCPYVSPSRRCLYLHLDPYL